MDHGWGSFRTVDGDVSVGHDVIRIDNAPTKFLRGQHTRWRNGNRGQRLAAVCRVLAFLWLPLYAIYQISTAFELSVGVAAALSFSTIAISLVGFWLKHLRGTEIRLSSVENVALDTDERELTVTHDADGRLAVLGDTGSQNWFAPDDGLSMFEKGETKTHLTLRTDDDVREARTVLRTRGIPVDIDAPEPKTEIEHRFETKNGVVFCEQCGSQVSPNDTNCPVCEYTLRVERRVTDDSHERLVEL